MGHEIVAGTTKKFTGGIVKAVVAKVIHNAYDSSTFESDIMILRVEVIEVLSMKIHYTIYWIQVDLNILLPTLHAKIFSRNMILTLFPALIVNRF